MSENNHQPWKISHRFDTRALPLADRHYNRQKVGSPQFVPPGRCVVLLTECQRALWVTSWPYAEYTKHRWAGAWVNTLFRNEGAGLSSSLIRCAVAATLAKWPTPPSLGLVTFVNPRKIRSDNPGFCYLRAGFVRDGYTKGGLVVLRLKRENMPEPQPPITDQLVLPF